MDSRAPAADLRSISRACADAGARLVRCAIVTDPGFLRLRRALTTVAALGLAALVLTGFGHSVGHTMPAVLLARTFASRRLSRSRIAPNGNVSSPPRSSSFRHSPPSPWGRRFCVSVASPVWCLQQCSSLRCGSDGGARAVSPREWWPISGTSMLSSCTQRSQNFRCSTAASAPAWR